MKDKTLHMVGNAHLDPVWLWRWQEGFQEAKATFRSALDRMREYPEFVFTSSSAAIYEWVERNEPAVFEEIKERVAEGRWRIVGGWWIQPDCNLPCGESFVRQGLYGQRYFREKLGVVATTGYNVDSFGHASSLPQILAKSGMSSYVFMRPKPHEKGLPAPLFWWESDDGSRVLTYRLPYTYNTTAADLEAHIRACAGEMDGASGEAMCFYGVGNHGGGPTKENIESIRRLNEDPSCPTLLFSTPDRFFAGALEKGASFPVVHDELQHHAVGCYSAHSGVKRWNRRSENLLLAAEKLSSVARQVAGQPYPAKELAHAWKVVLFNQFHDILAGTSIESAYEDARDEYGEAMSIAARALNYAVQSLAWRVRIEPEEGMRPIFVFNPHSWPTKTPVELDLGKLHETDTLLDEEGREVALQAVRSEATVGSSRRRLSFVADLPPMGYRVYRLLPGHGERAESPPVDPTLCELENEALRLSIDPATGHISSLHDKEMGVEVFAGLAAVPVVLADPSDTWSHGVSRYDEVVGTFTATDVRRIEHGPVRSVLRVTSLYGDSRIVQEFTLYRELSRIDVRVAVDWRERFKLLKLRFPLNLYFTKATYEVPYGHIERGSTGDEEPGQSWVDMTGIAAGPGVLYGLSLLNDGKYSYSTREGEIDLTVLRSPIYAHHVPAVPDPDEEYSFMDQGLQKFMYSLLPHKGTWQQAGTARRAAELNQPPTALLETYHNGPLPMTNSYLSVDAESVVVAALKQAEDNDDLIVRCHEQHGMPARARIDLWLWDRTIEAEFGPCEIKTFCVPRDPALPATETSLLEWAE